MVFVEDGDRKIVARDPFNQPDLIRDGAHVPGRIRPCGLSEFSAPPPAHCRALYASANHDKGCFHHVDFALRRRRLRRLALGSTVGPGSGVWRKWAGSNSVSCFHIDHRVIKILRWVLSRA